ncbi:hypothetical protein [Microcystis phage Mae-JY30]
MKIIGALTFLRSPLGRVFGVGLIALIALGYAYHQGAQDAARKCDAEALRSRIVTLERDLEIARQAADRARQQQAAAQAREATLNGRLEEYERSLAGTPDVCLLSPGDADRLRGLAR